MYTGNIYEANTGNLDEADTGNIYEADTGNIDEADTGNLGNRWPSCLEWQSWFTNLRFPWVFCQSSLLSFIFMFIFIFNIIYIPCLYTSLLVNKIHFEVPKFLLYQRFIKSYSEAKVNNTWTFYE